MVVALLLGRLPRPPMLIGVIRLDTMLEEVVGVVVLVLHRLPSPFISPACASVAKEAGMLGGSAKLLRPRGL